MSLQRILINDHPHITFISLSGVLSVFSMGPTPGMIPIVATLANLLIYSRILFPSFAQHTARSTVSLWATLAIGGSIPRLAPSLEALSQPGFSVLSLFLLSGLTSFFSVIALFLDAKFSSRINSESSRIILFPAIWSTLWVTIAYISPIGTLSTWTPVEGTSAYEWLVPILGPESLNWVVAAWAVVVSQTVTSWYMGSGEDNSLDADDDGTQVPGPLIPLGDETEGQNRHGNIANGIQSTTTNARSILTGKNKTAMLGAILVLLTIPSYLENNLPLPIADVDNVTPISVGCALPPHARYRHHELVLEDFIEETKTMDNRADFILWPEGAVRFNSEEERNKGLQEVRDNITHAYVGVSFEETLNDPSDPSGHTPVRRTGIAVISRKSEEPYLLYYKRHLVPIAESFSLTHSTDSPTTFEAEIQLPKKWVPPSQRTRQIPVTSSICLDFSAPSQFRDLDVKPGLILAPARTWDVTVGYTMWKQASERAREIGSAVLWCDGGAGGLSGIGGYGFSEVVQSGAGSWIRTIGLENPFDDRKTFYAKHNNVGLLLFWVVVVGSNVALMHTNVVALWRRLRSSRAGGQHNLLDA